MNNLEKKVREYMKLPYTIMLRRDEEGDIIARVKELEGCVADGQDEMEAIGNLESVKELWLETALKSGQSIPAPDSDDNLPSGKFLTRVPRSLHKGLIDIAAREGVSLNQLVTVGLAELVGRKNAISAPIEIQAGAQSGHHTTAYGSATSPRLQLVDNSRRPNMSRDRSVLMSESAMADVLSMQEELLQESLPSANIRKGA